MITYEQIKKANDSIITTDIKGKLYAEVNQRIKAFRMVYPSSTIETEMLSNQNGVCIFKATVRDGENILGTGTAYEKEGSTFINKTSYIENCETSAVGRALGMAGFGIDTSVASAEEVQNAMANQGTTKEPETPDKKTVKEAQDAKIDGPKWNALLSIARRKGVNYNTILKQYGLEQGSDMTVLQWMEACNRLNKMKDMED